MNTADILEKAALILERSGWCRGHYEKRPGGPVCVVGAIRRAAVGDAMPLYYEKEWAAERRLAEHLGLGLDDISLFDWNDDQRDRRKICRHLRAAAREARAAG